MTGVRGLEEDVRCAEHQSRASQALINLTVNLKNLRKTQRNDGHYIQSDLVVRHQSLYQQSEKVGSLKFQDWFHDPWA